MHHSQTESLFIMNMAASFQRVNQQKYDEIMNARQKDNLMLLLKSNFCHLSLRDGADNESTR